jgi:bacterioferritin
MMLELKAVARLNDAIKVTAEANDSGSRELLEWILIDNEEHVDWLEVQLHLIGEIRIGNYLSSQIGSEGKA